MRICNTDSRSLIFFLEASALQLDMHTMKNIGSGGGSIDKSNKGESRESITGILNPTICLHLGDVLLFTVTTRHYPQYDIDNLYNTNSDFDWGTLRKLKEELTLSWTPPSFFSFVFNQAGVYVFKLSSHHYKRMYVRVMPAGGQCYEPGPFFATIPRHMTRVGIRRRRNLLLHPDWLVTGGLLFGAALILCLCVTVLILFHEYGWPEKKPIRARYHSGQMSYHMEDYASKGSRVISQMKIHRKQQATMTLSSIQHEASEEFWDYEHQVDLEAFSSNTFYNLLLKHSVSVTARLGQLTTEVKELYQGVLEKLRLLHPCLVDEESKGEVHDKTRREVEKEVVRRRSLATHLRTQLHSQLQVLRQEQQAQQKVHSVFTAQMRECTRILGKANQISHAQRQQNLIQRLRSVVVEMGGLVSAECQRQGSWGLLGEGTGAKLLCRDSATVLNKDSIFGVVLPVGGVLLGESFIEPLSGKMARVGGASIQAGQLVPHAGGYQTLLDSKVLAFMFKIVELLRPLSEEWGLEPVLQGGEQGRQWQDCIRAAAIELHQHWRRSQHCQLQLQTRLEIMLDTTVGLHQNGGSLGEMALSGSDTPVPALLGLDYPDPLGSGLSVPVLGCRVDLVSGRTVGLAGTMEDPDGNGLVAIRYGSQAVDPVTAAVAPVVGARLDVFTNTVVPITASYWLAVADQTDSMQVEALEREMCARNTYWQQQRRREEDILSDADSTVFQCFLRVTEAGCHQEVQLSGKPLREAAVEMHDLAQAEAQRRAAQRATLALILPPHFVNILSMVDEEEWDQHCVWYTELVSGLDMVDVCMQQLQQDQDKWSMQKGDEWTTSAHVMDREARLGEIWERCSSRLSDLDVALIKLHFVRHLSNLRGDTAQAVLCGNFWYREYGLIRFCQPRPTGNIVSLLQWKILPLLERMNQQFVGDKQQVTLKANTSHQCTFGTDLQPDRAGAQPSKIAVPTIPEDEWTTLLEVSPLFQVLKGVEQELKDKSANSFVDVLECQWKCEGELIPLNPSGLNPREFLVYQHGLFLIHTLHGLQLTPTVSLQLAASLPNNNYHNNAFRNSFFYQEADETLFVRRQRLQSVGGFSLLLLHCLSHVATKDMSNDSAPAFGRLFCKVLQASLGELFQAKLALDSSAHEAHWSFRDDKSPWGHSKSFSLLDCGDRSAYLTEASRAPLSQHDIEDLGRKHRETSLVSQLERVLRKRNTATEEDRKHSLLDKEPY
ncbi:uncharacterized protein si:dkey-103g5.4 isoform X9 [Phyllopteryx taeniolatus]|uniref:uncharacterized protein si:dkey-103g5.4 isoform X9 n=1 Tax=Phyllopteryx taeniolatus TaxID=161469 RepID=UPI002AD3A06E|nr:uncharacterized protein si:dkey-103g5.4 isoform X9 [Phyllopteryx taeniolatus]